MITKRRGIRNGRRSIFGSKRGNAVADTITVVVIIFIFVITLVITSWLSDTLNDDIQAGDWSNRTKETVDDQNERLPTLFNNMFLTAFVLLWALVLVASWRIGANPLFFVFMVILLIGVLIVGAILGNTYEELTADGTTFASYAEAMPAVDFLMSNLLLVVLSIAFSVALVLYAKQQRGGL